ncbi:hypothetical protein QUF49_01560 [Fictibacillus sp. b24]|uniref:hypothetical protein n=1 Tax=unclassified Fictibacillus TaxID=2644029 RepID=UPI0025A01A51|nr:hypothetical protein [Fictibacillus sp. b24]MDM5314657.1 hypothetical protein [Fictibacillus sp. b24]
MQTFDMEVGVVVEAILTSRFVFSSQTLSIIIVSMLIGAQGARLLRDERSGGDS